MITSTQDELSSDRLPDRYEIVKRLGGGGFGVVYEAFDRERETAVALKYLNSINPDTLFRFKREFRSLAGISHPNLVGLYDLAEHEGIWFFTMELIDGSTLPYALTPETDYWDSAAISSPAATATRDRSNSGLRKSHEPAAPRRVRPAIDPDRVRRVFFQLAEGVSALHEAGRLHRDLKCSNLMVTPTGRVVLLDFGLVGDIAPRPGGLETVAGGIAGTPRYMAPEQCAGATVTQAADWYAMGVMLYRSLTGDFPFDGPTLGIFHAKQAEEAPFDEGFDDLPNDLATLCRQLLSRPPADRGDGDLVRDLIGTDLDRNAAPTLGVLTEAPLLGREDELEELSAAFEESRAGHPVTVLVHGKPGIGKSALVRHFVHGVAGRRRTTVVLEGRCYAQETLPYKALDGVIDSLVAYLLRLSDEEISRIKPHHVADLMQLFPVLRRVRRFEAASTAVRGIPDVQERQRRGFHALRELLGSIADRRPLVIFIDDLQWGDATSAAVLRRLLVGVDAPSLLLLGTYRSEDAARSAFLAEVLAADSELPVTNLEVLELDEERSRMLATRLLDGDPHGWAGELAHESGGNPLFIDVLTRHAKVVSREELLQSDQPLPPAPARLADVIRATVAAVPGESRRLVELLSICGRPLGPDVIRRALDLESLSPAVVGGLRAARLLKSRGTGASEELECYHDRIRETVVASLSPESQRTYHYSFARALEDLGSEDYETLALHYQSAREPERAFTFSVRAADRAQSSLSFARAARLYRVALDLGTGETQVLNRLRIALADAYRHAGLGADAAHAYLDAAEAVGQSAPRNALLMRHQAVEQLLFSGHLDEGMALLGVVLAAVGLRMPNHPAMALAAFAGRRAQLRVRGLDFTPRHPEAQDPDELLKIDVAWSVAIGLSMIDPIRAGGFQTHHLLLSLDAGDEVRIAKAVAVEIPFSATAGTKAQVRTRELERLSRRLTGGVDDPFVKALTDSCVGGAAWLEGRWKVAAELQLAAVTRLRRECTGVAWQLATTYIVRFDSLYRCGEWATLFAELEDVLDDAEARGDLFLVVYLRIKFRAMSHLAAGNPRAAERELDAAIGRWSKDRFTLLSFWHLTVSCEVDLYRGNADRARARLDAAWGMVKKSMLLTLQLYRVSIWDLRGRIELMSARQNEAAVPKRVKAARAAAKTLRKEKAGWADVAAAAIEAGAHSLLGDRGRAYSLLTETMKRGHATDMNLHAWFANHRRAQLSPGTGAREEMARTQKALADEGLTDLDRWADVFLPGAYERL
ncbi:MAG: hypothetical protein DRJ42_19340 [Deltaproteobacteria bacterium]|nr:MAG: hypothetical protein DRJ42_19340 [Deltaproteobacteria bacterium]